MRGLRSAKVNVSELVRRALREAAASEKEVKVKRSLLVQEVIAAIPGPARKTTRPPLDARRALSSYIQARLRRR